MGRVYSHIACKVDGNVDLAAKTVPDFPVFSKPLSLITDIFVSCIKTEMSAEFLPLQVSCTVAPLEDCRVCISIHYQQLASSVNTTRLTKVKFVLKCPTVGSAIDASPAVAR